MDEIESIQNEYEDVTVTVIIPYAPKYTPKDYLDRAVESAESQIGVDTEVLVIKDEEERGPAWARNVGLDQADTRYIAFLDGDDVWEETKLVRQLREMDETGAGMCVDGETDYDPVEFTRALLTAKTFALTSSILLDTDQVDHRFDESLERREDHMFMIEAASEAGVCFLPETFDIGKYEEGFSNHVDTSEEQAREFFERVVEKVPEAVTFRNEYYQTIYVYLGRREHFDGEYRQAIRHFLTSLRHGPNVKAVGALGITLLTMLYDYSQRPFRRVFAGSTHD